MVRGGGGGGAYWAISQSKAENGGAGPRGGRLRTVFQGIRSWGQGLSNWNRHFRLFLTARTPGGGFSKGRGTLDRPHPTLGSKSSRAPLGTGGRKVGRIPGHGRKGGRRNATKPHGLRTVGRDWWIVPPKKGRRPIGPPDGSIDLGPRRGGQFWPRDLPAGLAGRRLPRTQFYAQNGKQGGPPLGTSEAQNLGPAGRISDPNLAFGGRFTRPKQKLRGPEQGQEKNCPKGDMGILPALRSKKKNAVHASSATHPLG